MKRKDAWLILNMLPRVGPLRVEQLLSVFGSPDAILKASRSSLARVHGIGDALAETISAWQANCDLAAEKALIERGGIDLVTRDDVDYPELLAQIHDPPLCLYLRGDRGALAKVRAGLAIVGSRRTTSYGVRMARNLAAAAAYAGWPVVSGLARGIDTVAHEAVVQAGGCTVAVLGSGLGRVYPQENIELARRIAESEGAVVSEFPMMYRPEKRTFPMRNRIISGMTRGTLVVEAGAKSGSLITASQALEQNRQVFAVPGHVDSPQARGCHMLIKDGARLVEGFQDILEEFQALPGLGTRPTPGPSMHPDALVQAQSSPQDLQLPPLETTILTFLGAEERALDDIVSALQEPASHVLSAILMLEMRRLVRQLPGKRVVRCDGDFIA